jgi:hypothetical protein
MDLHKIPLALKFSSTQFAVSKTVHTKQMVTYAQTRLSLAPLNDVSTQTVTVVVSRNVMPRTSSDT